MRGILIFLSIVAVNIILLIFTSLVGVIVVDLSAAVTLLIFINENHNELKREKIRRRNMQVNKKLLEQAEQSKRDFDEKDLPSPKDIDDLSNERDESEKD